MRRKRDDEVKPGAPEWMTTYGDMVTLLLTFFVLLFAMSEIDAQKFQTIIRSFQGSPGILDAGKTIENVEFIDEPTNNELQELEDLKKLAAILDNYLKEKDLNDDILIELDYKGLILRFEDNILFDSGEAEIKDKARPTLLFLSDILKQEEFSNKAIRIEGHTDSDPIRFSRKYPTNWELSVARASHVVRFMIEQAGLDPDRLSAAGYSEYKSVASNDTEEGKSKNRRVDIVVLRDKYR
ncbi:MAG: flagellar motor protein MotB [Bacillota bacterium]